MKIIKQGNYDPDQTKRFECNTCGCIFDAGKNEYQSTFQYNETEYWCECPTCHSNVKWKQNFLLSGNWRVVDTPYIPK